MKLESDKRVVCDGSCSECPRCLRLYFCDAVDCGGISAWRTWLGSRIALPNSSSSAMLHSSSNVGRSSGLTALFLRYRARNNRQTNAGENITPPQLPSAWVITDQYDGICKYLPRHNLIICSSMRSFVVRFVLIELQHCHKPSACM